VRNRELAADHLRRAGARLPAALAPQVDDLAAASGVLRRDRDLAFYGAEDLTPSSFYREADAQAARDRARDVVASVGPHVEESGSD
jgi:hypothetical protein